MLYGNSNENKKHSWCCGTPKTRIFIARCRNWRKSEVVDHVIIIYRCSRSIKYFHLLPWSVIASDERNQRAKFWYSALSTFRDIDLRIWKRFCVIQANGVSNIDQIWRGCNTLSTINCSNLVHLCWAVPEILDRENGEIVYKMAAGRRTKEASDVKFGTRASFIELYLWSKFGDPSSYGVQTQMPSRRRRRRRRSTRPMPRTPSPTPLGSGVKNKKKSIPILSTAPSINNVFYI